MHYLKFFVAMPVFLLVTVFGLALGGNWMYLGIGSFVFLQLPADSLLPRDRSAPNYAHPWLLDMMLYAALPLVAAMVGLMVWMAGAHGDVLGIAQFVSDHTGWNLFEARAKSQRHYLFNFFGALLSVTLMSSIAATNVAHELMHRGRSTKVAMSRLLLLFSFDLPLVISHLYGHHILVGTPEDHTTARRGESLYAFIWRSTVDGNLNAWEIEASRLRLQDKANTIWRNKVLQAWVGYAAMILAAGLLGGVRGATLFLICALITKAILESVNYIQHYGLKRAEGTRIAPHHSWNSDHSVSSWLLFNVTRHSHHHAEPEVPFWQLRSIPHVPMLPFGYLLSLLVSMVPPLWYRVMELPLQDWDRRYPNSETTRSGEMYVVRQAV